MGLLVIINNNKSIEQHVNMMHRTLTTGHVNLILTSQVKTVFSNFYYNLPLSSPTQTEQLTLNYFFSARVAAVTRQNDRSRQYINSP